MNVTVHKEEPWLDGDAGRLVRPYTVSDGRTRPTKKLDLLSLVMATGWVRPAHLDADHAQALALCHQPTSVAEIAARLRLPAVVTKVLLSDLVDCGAVTTHLSSTSDHTDRLLLQKVLDGLRRRL